MRAHEHTRMQEEVTVFIEMVRTDITNHAEGDSRDITSPQVFP